MGICAATERDGAEDSEEGVVADQVERDRGQIESSAGGGQIGKRSAEGAPDLLTTGLQPVKAKKGFAKCFEMKRDRDGRASLLGEGNYAEVKECLDRSTGERYAVKILKDSKLEHEDKVGLQIEISLLRQICHPNIIFLKDYFFDEGSHYVVVELLLGGELFEDICAKEKYDEVDARQTVTTLLSAIGYMHERNIVHRDLKPENIMLDKSGEGSTIKLIDFGFAKRVGTHAADDPDDPMLHTACGTPQYVAPEVIPADQKVEPQYGKPVDVWALGVITYILLCGYPPFLPPDGTNNAALFKLIRSGDYCFYEDDWISVTQDARDVIRKMLIVDPAKRWTVSQLQRHAWFADDAASFRKKSARDLHSAQTKLKKYLARRRLKKGISAATEEAKTQQTEGGRIFVDLSDLRTEAKAGEEDAAPTACLQDVALEEPAL